jgi:1-acyl-sn-glycerol-3-phosphate acyltransferase
MLDKVLYRSGRRVVYAYARLMFDMDVVKHAPLPEGPKIIAANHPTTTDPFFILTVVSEQMSVLVSGGIFEVPVFGRYLRLAGHVPVVHNSGGATIEAARRLLEAGRTLAIFPEGALSPLEGGLGFHRPHSGVARLALSTGAPVIPVGIHLERERIRFVETKVDGESEVGRLYLRGPYAMTVGEPMRFRGDVEDWEYVRSVSERIMQRIIRLSRESALRVQESQALETGAITRPIGVASVS